MQSTHNASFFKVTNFAILGATIESHPIEPKQPGANMQHARTMREEIDTFVGSENDDNHKPFKDWKPDTSLFATWFGVNEVLDAVRQSISIPYEPIFATYASSLDRLHGIGARNFLLLNVPPLDAIQGPDAIFGAAADYINEFNARLDKMHETWVGHHPGVKMFLFDVHGLWMRLIRNPEYFAEYGDFQNVIGWCPGYAWHSNDLEDFKEIILVTISTNDLTSFPHSVPSQTVAQITSKFFSYWSMLAPPQIIMQYGRAGLG
ncbi:MAG: hypothetical protein Q9162_001307 [Coniocarpon cinnabarinum]